MQHWTDYWQNTSSLNSFAEGEQGSGYKSELKDLWDEVFNKTDNQSKVVDLGTGNGALALLAQEYSDNHHKDFTVTGVDIADINPHKLSLKDKSIVKSLNKINFIGKTPIEKIPFDENSVEVFISQFAFEYSSIEQSIKKCFSSLKPGGLLSIVAHHDTSHITDDSRVGEHVLDVILNESPVFMQTDFLLDIANQQAQSGNMSQWQNNPYNQTITATLHWIFNRLTQQFSSETEEYWCKSTISHVTSILKQVGRQPASQLKAHLQQTYHNLHSHRLRLRDQNKATLNDKSLDAIKMLVNDLGGSFNSDFVNIEGKPFGIHITIIK